MISWQTAACRACATATWATLLVMSTATASGQFCCFLQAPAPRPISSWIAESEIAVVARRVAINPDHPARYARLLKQRQRHQAAYELEMELVRQAYNNRSSFDWFVDGVKESLGLDSDDTFELELSSTLRDLTDDQEIEDQPYEDEEIAGQGSTTYQICWIAKGPADLRPGQRVEVGELDSSGASQYYLLLGDNKLAGIEWTSHSSDGESFLTYLQKVPSDNAPRLDRLRFYFDFLGSPCKTVADDAGVGISTIDPTDSEWETFARSLTPDEIRALAAISESDYDMCSLLISYVGNQDDARKLSDRFWAVPARRFPDQSCLCNFLRLRGESGLDELDARFRTSSRDFPRHKAVYLNTILTLAIDPHPKISRERLKKSLRLMLSDRKFAAAAIRTLADWRDWTVLDQVARLYGAEDFDRRHIREAIVYYLASSSMDYTGFRQRQFPAHALKAGFYLNDLRTRDRRTYKYMAALIESAILDEDSRLADSVVRFASSWRALIPQGRIASPREHAVEGLKPFPQSAEARAIEKNLGFD